MFSLGFGEIVIICLILIVVVGPERLPSVMKSVGKTMRTVRQASRDLRETVGIDELMREDYLHRPLPPAPPRPAPPATVSRTDPALPPPADDPAATAPEPASTEPASTAPANGAAASAPVAPATPEAGERKS